MTPIKIPKSAGKPYRPSNGTEGEMFMERFCYQCKHDQEWLENETNPCQILNASLFFCIDDKEYPKEWVFDPGGVPTCTKFEQKLKKEETNDG